jgi:hypothetical protein
MVMIGGIVWHRGHLDLDRELSEGIGSMAGGGDDPPYARVTFPAAIAVAKGTD